MADKPDFIVDPSGNVQDVRQIKAARQAEPPPLAGSGGDSSGPGRGIPLKYQSLRASSGVRRGFIIIPIGLLLTLAIALFRLLNPALTNNTHSESAVSELNSGNLEYVDGNYEMALVDFNLAIASDPNFGEAYNSRGLVYGAQGNYGKAIADFDKAIELLPNWAGSYNNRGTVYFDQGDYDQAIADFGQAIQLDAKFGKAYFNRGLIFQVLGNYEAAIADFDKTIELTPESELAAMSTLSGTAEAGFSFASTYRAISDLSSTAQAGGPSSMVAGLTNYLKLTQSSADLSLAYANRGLAYYHLGDFEHAGADLEKALSLSLDPTDQEWVETLLVNLH